MCLIVFAWQTRSDLPLIVAANRDEFYARAAAPAQFWPEQPDLLAGRDLLGGGTWLGVTSQGRWAALTNYRDGKPRGNNGPSRGLLVSRFLRSRSLPREFLGEVQRERNAYDGFNLLVGTRDALHHYSNRGGPPAPVAPGYHGLSNHLLDTPWPKVERGRNALGALASSPREALIEGLFGVLGDATPPDDAALPDTGVGLAWERVLATPFIRSPNYGTRCSTVMLLDAQGEITFIERTFADGVPGEEPRSFKLRLDAINYLG
jgi:uncharacterized protein with NRDE domain